MFRTKITASDAIAAVSVLLAALLIVILPLFFADEGGVLVITTAEGDAEYALSEARELTLTENGVTLTVVIADGCAYVAHSDCPDGVCVASGRISREGEMILCAPAGVTLRIKGGGDDVDFIAG